MSWSFETSLLVFLAIIFLSQAVATLTRGKLSLPLVLGLICMAGFGGGFFPADFIVKSKMKDVGYIAFNVLVVHSGTTLNLSTLKSEWKSVALSAIVVLALSLALVFGLEPLVGRPLAVLSPGPAIGGGAACAIASNAVVARAPLLAPFPWMIFMVQGIFCTPLFAWAIRKEALRLARGGFEAGSRAQATAGGGVSCSGTSSLCAAPEQRGPTPAMATPARLKLCDRVPPLYRTTSFYLCSLMAVSVFNRWLNLTLVPRLGISPVITALIFGIILGQFGLMERDPLSKSDSMGFLMLGLMALMANSFAQVPLSGVLALAGPALLAVAAGTIVLAAAGLLFGRLFACSRYKSLTLALNCMVGFPFGMMIAKKVLASVAKDESQGAFLESELIPPLEAGSILVTNVISIFIASLVGGLL